MFDTGKQIIVLQSTSVKKSGPRRGSLGFISDTFGFAIVEDMVFVKADVFFHRYGFRSSPVFEKRTVVLALPIIKNPFVESNMTKTIKRCLVHTAKKVKRKLTEGIRLVSADKNTPVCVTGPINTSIMESDHIFYSWVGCMLNNDFLNDVIDVFTIAEKNPDFSTQIDVLNFIRAQIVEKKNHWKNEFSKEHILNSLRLVFQITQKQEPKQLIGQTFLRTTLRCAEKNDMRVFVELLNRLLTPVVFKLRFSEISENIFKSINKDINVGLAAYDNLMNTTVCFIHSIRTMKQIICYMSNRLYKAGVEKNTKKIQQI